NSTTEWPVAGSGLGSGAGVVSRAGRTRGLMRGKSSEERMADPFRPSGTLHARNQRSPVMLGERCPSGSWSKWRGEERRRCCTYWQDHQNSSRPPPSTTRRAGTKAPSTYHSTDQRLLKGTYAAIDDLAPTRQMTQSNQTSARPNIYIIPSSSASCHRIRRTRGAFPRRPGRTRAPCPPRGPDPGPPGALTRPRESDRFDTSQPECRPGERPAVRIGGELPPAAPARHGGRGERPAHPPPPPPAGRRALATGHVPGRRHRP